MSTRVLTDRYVIAVEPSGALKYWRSQHDASSVRVGGGSWCRQLAQARHFPTAEAAIRETAEILVRALTMRQLVVYQIQLHIQDGGGTTFERGPRWWPDPDPVEVIGSLA